ncbi:MAG: class I SAM-dependent methyltransferase [Rhodospirillales bacterium]|nr:class I SAM-dependent methyltransferase [Rhodospirillales bacterium]
MNKIVNADMIEYWNSAAGRKWVRFQSLMDMSLLPFGQGAMDASGVKTGDTVIDVGSGCGDTTFELAQRVGLAGQVLGIDVSKPALAQAQGRAAYKTTRNFKFAQGDAQTHPFDAAAYDLIFSRFGIMFFDDPVAAFHNLWAALKPGGRLAFVCWRPADENEWVRVPCAAAREHLPQSASPVPGAPGPFSFGSADRTRQVLADAGFAGIAIEPYDAPLVADASLDEAVDFLMQIGPVGSAIVQSGMDNGTKARLAADLRKALEPFYTSQGVALGAAAWIVTAHKS